MNAVTVLLVLAALGGAVGAVQTLRLTSEQGAHKATQAALAEEVSKGIGWKAAYEKTFAAVEVHRDATQACIDREVEAAAARKEREALLQAEPPRPRTDAEKQQVVNDETRIRAADRLNRSW